VLQLEQSNGALSRILRLFRRTQSTAPERKRQPAPPSPGCVVKGMGLVVAVQQRTALFCIHLLRLPYRVSPPEIPIPDIAVRIEGPNSDYGEAIIQKTGFNMSNEKTINQSQSFTNGSNKFPCKIPINYSVTSGCIRISYIPQSPGVHELSVIVNNEHVPESPYLVTVDSNVPNVTGCLSFSVSDAKKVSRNRPERRKILLRTVNFITEQILLTQEGELKKLPSDGKVSVSRIPRQMAVCFSFGGINKWCESGSNDKNSMEQGNVSDMEINKRRGLSLVILPLNADTNKGSPQTDKLSRRDLDLYTCRCREVISLCSLLLKRNRSHNIFQMLHSVESVLNGRPVRLTEKTFKLIETGMKSIKPETLYDIDERSVTEVFGREVLKIHEICSNADVTNDCEQTLTKCEDLASSSHKTSTEDKATNKCSKYKNVKITRHETSKTSSPIATEIIHFDGNPNVCTNHKNICLYVGANEFISVDKPQNLDISGYYKKVYRNCHAGKTTNFMSSISSILPANKPVVFYRPFHLGFDDEGHSYYKTINISTENEQMNEKSGNHNVNKQLQTIRNNCENVVAIEIENSNLNKIEALGLQGPENGTHRAILVHITDDGHVIPAEQSLQLLTKSKTSSNKIFKVESGINQWFVSDSMVKKN